jgi:hypothetical protein
VNAYKRLHGLIVDVAGLDFISTAQSFAAETRERTMTNPVPRRGRGARRPTRRQSPRLNRVTEGHRMNPQLSDQDVRQELVTRVRQEILDGTYDTPEKFEVALGRLADRLEGD